MKEIVIGSFDVLFATVSPSNFMSAEVSKT